MGSEISTILFQPLLLGTAVALMIVALIYQNRTCSTLPIQNGQSPAPPPNTGDPWGSEIFKIDMGLATVIVLIAVILGFIMSFTI
jgi:hypothetical protein